MENITKQIDLVIQSRKPLFEIFSNLENLLFDLNSNIFDTKEFLEILNHNSSIVKLSEASETINQNFIPIISKLKARFNRNSINIGVIGRAGQGKSTLLQKLTGLSNNEIPSGSKGHCTGVKSIIENYDCSESYAEISFYTRDEFLNDVLKPYFNELALGTISSLSEFEIMKLPILGKEKALDKSKYDKLQELKNNFIHYKSLIGSKNKIVNKKEIREYVAQDNENGQRIYFNYLAVKLARIFCKYPTTNVSKIALLDTPGLGDTGIGAEDRLIEGLSKDTDFILFIKKPSEDRAIFEDSDIHLYDLASNAIKEIPIEKWSMYILNTNKTDNNFNGNFDNSTFLKNNINKSNIKTAKCLIANCNSEKEAKEFVLEELLKYLSENIVNIDKEYIKGFNEKLLNFCETVNNIINEIKLLFTKNNELVDTDSKFDELFDKFWEDLGYKLQNLLKEFDKTKDIDNSEFLNNIKNIIKEAENDKNIPNLEEMSKRVIASNNLINSYNDSMVEMRAHLSQKFLKLDDNLHDSVNIMKIFVGKTLAETNLSQLLINESPEKYLWKIYNEIDNSNQELKEAFKMLLDFNLSFRGLIQHRIRKNFDPIYPNTTRSDLRESIKTPSVAIEALELLYDEVLSDCKYSLESLSKEPSMANFSIFEEFIDRALRAKGMKNKWRSFTRTLRNRIWVNDFKFFEEKTRERDRLNNLFNSILTNTKDIKDINLRV